MPRTEITRRDFIGLSSTFFASILVGFLPNLLNLKAMMLRRRERKSHPTEEDVKLYIPRPKLAVDRRGFESSYSEFNEWLDKYKEGLSLLIDRLVELEEIWNREYYEEVRGSNGKVTREWNGPILGSNLATTISTTISRLKRNRQNLLDFLVSLNDVSLADHTEDSGSVELEPYTPEFQKEYDSLHNKNQAVSIIIIINNFLRASRDVPNSPTSEILTRYSFRLFPEKFSRRKILSSFIKGQLMGDSQKIKPNIEELEIIVESFIRHIHTTGAFLMIESMFAKQRVVNESNEYFPPDLVIDSEKNTRKRVIEALDLVRSLTIPELVVDFGISEVESICENFFRRMNIPTAITSHIEALEASREAIEGIILQNRQLYYNPGIGKILRDISITKKYGYLKLKQEEKLLEPALTNYRLAMGILVSQLVSYLFPQIHQNAIDKLIERVFDKRDSWHQA